MRDSRQDEVYFQNYIELVQDDLDFYQRKLPELSPDRVERVKQKIFLHKIDMLQAMYSSGSAKEEIRSYYLDIIEEIELPNARHRYVELVWLFSFAILFDIPGEKFRNINAFVERDDVEDRVIDILRSHFLEDLELSDNLMHPDPYKGIADAFEMNKEDAQNRLKKYLESEWYAGHKDTGWYNGHKSSNDIYSGYWSYETAAIVKMKGLDDTSFQNNEYYPADLL